MSFLNPVFLFALIAVGLPLLIHLLNLRKPTRVQFSTLAFFKELQKSTIRKIKIKRILLLLLRLLAVACLAMVLARPFLPPALSVGSSANQPTIHAILLDNSISMNRIGAKGPLSDQAKDIVLKILDESKEGDRFLIQTTNGEPVNTSVSSANQIQSRLGEIEVVKKGAFLSERINNLISVLEETPFQNKNLYIIDDRNPELMPTINNELAERTSGLGISIFHVEDVKAQNTFISDVASSSSMVGKGIPFTVEVSVTNEGEVVTVNQFLTLMVEGSTVGQYPLQIEAGVTQSFSFEVNPDKNGSITGTAIIEGDGFSFDNEYFFSIQVPEKRDILWLTKKSRNPGDVLYTSVILDAQLEGDNQINYTKATLDQAPEYNIGNFDALILEGLDQIPEFLFREIQEFVQNGKGIVFFPSETADIQNYNDFLSLFNAGSFVGVLGDFTSFNAIAKGSVLLEDHPIFDGLFTLDTDEELSFTVPDIYYYLKLRTNSSGLGLNIIEMNNGDPLLREKKFGEGRVLLFSIGNNPSWSNFPVKALYAPTYYRTILYAASLEEGGLSNQFLGKPFEWRGNADAETTELVYKDEAIQITPQNVGGAISLSYNGYEWEPGWVTVTDGENIFKTAINLSRSESLFGTRISEESGVSENVNIVDSGALTSEQIIKEIRSSGFGKEVWHWFMLAGFLLLITESLVSIFYKAETVA